MIFRIHVVAFLMTARVIAAEQTATPEPKSQGPEEKMERKIIKREEVKQPSPLTVKQMIITHDCGEIAACGTLSELDQVAEILIAARPDIQVIDAAAGDLCYYPSQIGHYWPNFKGGERGLGAYDRLIKEGRDPLGLVYKRLKVSGITTLAGFRMNDHHGYEHMWTPWQREHIAWSLGKDTGNRAWNAVGSLRQMDYTVADVRAHHLKLLEEMLTRYDLDGLQLDFGRSAPFLSEPKVKNALFLTQFVRDVRGLLARIARDRGREKLILGAIVPWDLEFCSREGIEVAEWIREGLVDYVSPGEWYYSDWNIPIHHWAILTRGTMCALIPVTMGSVSGRPNSGFEQHCLTLLRDNCLLDGPKVRALAETFYDQGADGVNFFNVAEQFRDDPSLRVSLRRWIAPKTIASDSRHYFYAHILRYIPTEHYTYSQATFARLKLHGAGATASYDFRFGADLTGQRAILRMKSVHAGTDALVVMLNGTPLTARTIAAPDVQQPDVLLWEFEVTAPSLRRGDNTISVAMQAGRDRMIEVGEFEIFITPAKM